MFIEKEIPICDLIYSISEAIDLASPILESHHKKVAYISCKIAQEMKLSGDDVQHITLAAMLHDIGVFSINERLKILKFVSTDESINDHAIMGYKLLKGFAPFEKVARLIKYHHTDFDKHKREVSLGSYIINLADRVSTLMNEQQEILEQVPEVLEKINLYKHKFHPGAVAALFRLAGQEYFWLEALNESYRAPVLKKVLCSKKIIGLDTLRNFAKAIAQVIDFRSRFTATHSRGVAAVAQDLSAISGFSESECKLMEIAGFLHDIGKLAVPNDILEKNGKLTDKENNMIRKHTYYTYAILSKLNGMEDLAAWAAHHHERHDGNGYPFHVRGRDFSKLARVMAVADVFTALSEDRPYRLGLNMEKTVVTLLGMAKNGAIDKDIADLANKNFLRINAVCMEAQQEARNEYAIFNEGAYQFRTTAAVQSA